MSFIVTTRPPSLVVMVRSSSTPELTKLGHVSGCGLLLVGAVALDEGLGRVRRDQARGGIPIDAVLERRGKAREVLAQGAAGGEQALRRGGIVGVATIDLDLRPAPERAEVVAQQRPGAVDREVPDVVCGVDRRRLGPAACALVRSREALDRRPGRRPHRVAGERDVVDVVVERRGFVQPAARSPRGTAASETATCCAAKLSSSGPVSLHRRDGPKAAGVAGDRLQRDGAGSERRLAVDDATKVGPASFATEGAAP